MTGGAAATRWTTPPRPCFDGEERGRETSSPTPRVTVRAGGPPRVDRCLLVRSRTAHGQGLLTIELEPPRFASYSRADYALMYHAIRDVDDAVHRLRLLLPVPGSAMDVERARHVSEAERDLLDAWVRYLCAYDAVYAQ